MNDLLVNIYFGIMIPALFIFLVCWATDSFYGEETPGWAAYPGIVSSVALLFGIFIAMLVGLYVMLEVFVG